MSEPNYIDFTVPLHSPPVPDDNSLSQQIGILSKDEISIYNWNGIDNTGQNDSTNGLLNAIKGVPTGQGGYVLKFPPGIYLISSALIIQALQRLTLRGSGVGGSNATIIKCNNPNVDMIDASTNLLDTFSMEYLQLQGAGAGSGTGRGLLLGRSAQSAYDSRIEHCWFTAMPASSIYGINMQGYHISSNGIENGQYGVNIQNGSDNVITNNRFYANTKAGVFIASGSNNTINVNHFDLNGSLGDDTTGAIVISNSGGTENRNNLIAANNFDQNKQDIALIGSGTLAAHTGVSNTTIQGNTSDFAQRRSIYINGANGTRILSNTINDANQASASLPAIDINSSDRTVLDGNVVTYLPGGNGNQQQTYGLTLEANTTNTTLGDNKFTGSVGDINLASGATLMDLDIGTGWQTYTPTLYGASTAGANTYSLQAARWKQVGHEVTVYVDIALSAKDAAMAGAVRIPLPVTAGNIANIKGITEITSFQGITPPANGIVTGNIPAGSTYAQLLVSYLNGSSASLLDTATLSGTAAITLRMSYMV